MSPSFRQRCGGEPERLVFEFGSHLAFVRDHLPARRAPSRPDIEHDDFAAVVFEIWTF